MNNEAYEQVNEWGKKKAAILHDSPLRYILKAMLASFFIGFAVMLSFRLSEPFFDAGSPASTLMLGAFFGIALVLILYGSAELFTGNTMYLTMSTAKGHTSVKDAIAVLAACYGGNLLGAVVFAFFIQQTGIFHSVESTNLLMSAVAGKMSYPVSDLFFRAMLCNWIVCLAVWIPMQMKGDMAKIVAMMLCVMTFVVAGFEHSVANMVLFSMALAVPHPEAITIAGAVHNLIPVTLGNIVGGSVFVGLVYLYLAKPIASAKEKEQTVSVKWALPLKSRRP